MTSEALRIDPARTAFVAIEYQRDWLHPDGKIHHLMADRAQFAQAQAQSRTLFAAVRRAGLPLVHVGLRFGEGHPELGQAAHGLRAAIPKIGSFVGPGAAFQPPFDPRAGEAVAAGRIGASGFAGSNLDALLRHRGIDTLLLAGFALHVCVESTLRQAHDLGYTAFVVEDATAAFTPEQRRHVLEEVVHHFGARVTVDEVVDTLERAARSEAQATQVAV